MQPNQPTYVQVAREFMAVRSYGDLAPFNVERVHEEFVWYIEYELAEGDLTLEVTWDPDRGWAVSVWDFQLRP